MSGKVGVVLFNYGGPDGLSAVEPYIRRIFEDEDLIGLPFFLRPFRVRLARWAARRRAPKVRDRYRRIGGRSPLLEVTRAQAHALEQALAARGECLVVIAMRYFSPDSEEAVRRLRAENVRRVVLLPLYPHYSVTTTGSSLKEFERVARTQGFEAQARWHLVRSYHDHPRYIAAVAAGIERVREALPPEVRDGTPVVFSAHGLPQKLVDRGDPYREQVEETVRLVAERLSGDPRTLLAYQSKVGPVRWLAPTIKETIRTLAEEGCRHAIVYPVSFVSDHLETLYELDVRYRDVARGLGIELHRVPVLGTDGLFIEALADLVLTAASQWIEGEHVG